MVKIFTDGACEPVNPGGIATWGFIINQSGQIIHHASGVILALKTNNTAEYYAMLQAAKWLCANLSGEDIYEFHSDSKILISQINGDFKIKSSSLKRLFEDLNASLDTLKNRSPIPELVFNWVPREANSEADSLTQTAYEQYAREHPEEIKTLEAQRPPASKRPSSGAPRSISSRKGSDGATEKQKALLGKLRVKFHEDITLAEASRLIDEKLKSFKRKK